MDQVFFIVLGHRVKNQIDTQVKSVPALCLATGSARVGPFSRLIALPGAAEIVLAVDHRHGAADADTVERRANDAHAADTAQQVITA